MRCPISAPGEFRCESKQALRFNLNNGKSHNFHFLRLGSAEHGYAGLSPFAIAGRAHIWARSFGIREPCQVPFNQIWYLGSHACDDSEAGVTWAKLTSKSELIEKSLSNIGNNMARKDARIISAGFGRCDLSMRRKPRRGGPSVLLLLCQGGWQKVTRPYRNQEIPEERCWVRGSGWCLACS
jgi:hypothetical protein